jgi:hypothetical protein
LLVVDQFVERCTYFRKLPPVEEVAGIVLEDENIIDLGRVPNTARKTEK